MGIEMIDKLFYKLYLVFISAIMFIITLVFIMIQINVITLERANESSLFQRLATMIIYQMSAGNTEYTNLFSDYEQYTQMFFQLKDVNGNLLYESNSLYPTEIQFLLTGLEMQKEYTVSCSESNLKDQAVTEQSGFVRIKGKHKDSYLGITSKIVMNDGIYYDLKLILPQKSSIALIKPHLPFYLTVWVFSLLTLSFLCYFLLQKAISPVKHSLISQKNFVASASHELKSPLAVISANAEIIGYYPNQNPKITGHLQVIDSECQRMSHLIQDMLFLASSDTNTWLLKKSDVCVDTLLITLYETYEPVCIQKGIKLKLDLGDISYPVLYTDQERLIQILSIFMDNAIYYSPIDSIIELQTKLYKKYITFLVVDHGKGIAEKDKPFIFERFYCEDYSRTDKSHFGLGLSIAEELTKLMHGKIGLVDTPGGGSTFYVSFPLKIKVK